MDIMNQKMPDEFVLDENGMPILNETYSNSLVTSQEVSKQVSATHGREGSKDSYSSRSSKGSYVSKGK